VEHIKDKKGFSLVEMLVVLSIFTFMTLLALAGYNKFNSQTLLDSLAYDVALSFRQAQSYGLSVRGSMGGSGFETGYGLYFDKNSDTSYILFADVDGDRIYDGDSSCAEGSECIDRFVLSRGYKISDICAVIPDGSEKCTSSDEITNVSAIFERPDPDAILVSDVGGTYQEIRVTVQSPTGSEQNVSVFTTGQISVGEGTTPPTPPSQTFI